MSDMDDKVKVFVKEVICSETNIIGEGIFNIRNIPSKGELIDVEGKIFEVGKVVKVLDPYIYDTVELYVFDITHDPIPPETTRVNYSEQELGEFFRDQE